VLVLLETPFGRTTWGDPESSALPLPNKLTTSKISPRSFGPRPSALRASVWTLCHVGSALQASPFRRASALRASALRSLQTCSPTHCPRRRFFARSTAFAAPSTRPATTLIPPSVEEYISPTPFIVFLYTQIPWGPWRCWSVSICRLFSKLCIAMWLLFFTIDSTRRPLTCIKNLPMGNSRKPEKSGLFV